ncbi:Protein of unknown function (DUF1501) [hydrothermal vent metagenome]|uniref:DUF1501 domain-containing protein n=1 Tax=hydrothermal vent metagenome TaxID=652676 RepID=A0A3B0XVB1_9ZZZZ
MNRRKFLKGVLGTGVAAGTGTLGSLLGISAAHANHAAGATAPTLVVIFQRGGCDGLNTVVPYGDLDYAALRPTIGIPSPTSGIANSAIAIEDTGRQAANLFGLNPNMSALKTIFDAGDLAVMPTVHYPNNSRSHFSGQDYIESASPNTISDGWLYRHLSSKSTLGGLEGLGFGSSLQKSLRGTKAIQSLTFLRDFGFTSAAGDIVARLKQNVLPLYEAAPPINAGPLVNNTGVVMFNNIDTLGSIDTAGYRPSNGAVYPGTSYGRRLRETAQIIKQGVGTEVLTVDVGGYDTHTNQGNGDPAGKHSRRLKEFADGIGALYTDLGAAMDNVVILTMTEFGRTARENGSAGTDHGNASSWFMVGKSINGGIHGKWPGLSSTALRNGRYLDFTVDYRDIYGEIMNKHLGQALTDIPNLIPTNPNGNAYTYNPVGLFA